LRGKYSRVIKNKMRRRMTFTKEIIKDRIESP